MGWFVTQQIWKNTEFDETDNFTQKYKFSKFTQDKVESRNSPNAIKEIKSEV